MDVQLCDETAEIVKAYLQMGAFETPDELVHAALTYFAMRPEDWRRLSEQAEVGLQDLDSGRVVEFESTDALMDYLEARRAERHRRNAS
jgi:Arc/MetJ-type ribon-helix-helix transcriptional regulator